MAGVKLDNNTGNTKHSERLRKTRSALWLEWNSTTTQETRNKANGELNDVKTYEFSEITKTKALWGDEGVLQRQQRSERRNEKTSIPSNFRKQSRKWGVYHGDTVAGAALQQRHRNMKPEKNRLEMFVQMGTTLSWWTGINAGLRVRSKKTSGLPIVGDSKTIHVSKSRPFWNK